MNRAVLGAFLRHWWRAPLQLLTLLGGLALATALWSGVQAINAEARASYDAAAATLGEGRFDQLQSATGAPIEQSTYVALRRAGWLVSPVIEGRLNGVRLVGIEPLTAPGGLGPIEIGEGAELADFVMGQGQVFGDAEALSALAAEPVTGVLSPDVAPNTALTDIGVAQRLLNRPAEIDRLVVAQAQPQRQTPLAQVAPDLVRQAAQDGTDIGGLTESFHLNLTAFGLLSFAVGIFIVNGAIGLAFEQRRPMVRTLRALGVPLRRVMALMAAELLVIALVAGAAGVCLGYLIAAALLPDVAATLRGLYGADVASTLQLRPAWWLSGLAIAVGGAGLAALRSFAQLARMPLLSAAHPRAQSMAAGRSARVQAVVAVGLLITALLIGAMADGLAWGFALLACLLIGAALGLPAVLGGLLTLAQGRAHGVIAQWFWADTRQQLPGLSLALMALLLAMAANVGVSTMVSSFRMTFTAFLDQRLASELYITADTLDDVPELLDYLAPRVAAILPIQSVPVTIAGQPTELFGARDDATYRDNWAFLNATTAPWESVAAGDGILLNEQLARRGGIDVGAAVSVAGRGFRVAGIYGDYGNPLGQAIVNERVFASLFPTIVPTRFGLRLPTDEVPRLVADLEADLGLSPASTINQAAIKAFSLDVFDRTFTVTTALNVLTLIVAGFAILMSLLTLATLRVPQLAPVWAAGVTRAQLGRLELVRAVLLALLTTVLALPLGLLLAWALLAVVNVAAFGWKLPMFFFPLDYARLGLFALLAAALAALWPAWRLSRTPPAALVKVFSDER